MTTFDILVPLVALGFGLGAAWYARWAAKRFDREHNDSRLGRHPAE